MSRHKIASGSDLLRLSEFKDIVPVKTQGTSDFYKATYRNTPFFIKNVIKNKKRSRVNNFHIYDIELGINELLASLIYNKVFHVPALRLYLVYNDNSDPEFPMYLIGSKIEDIDDCSIDSKICKALYSNQVEGTIEPILVDSVMSNWDVGHQGNIVIRHPKGEVIRLDVGGSLLYRARGGPREYQSVPYEHLSFLDPKNVSYSLFRHIDKNQISEAFKLLKKANWKAMTAIEQSIMKQMSKILPSADQKKAKKVFRSVPILKERVKYYLKNQEEVTEEMLDAAGL